MKTVTNFERIRILWTGGFDSTYMLCALAKTGKYIVEPIYVLNPKRKSYKCEIDSMQQILKVLKQDQNLKSKIGELKIIQRSKRVSSEKQKAYKALNKFMHSKNKYLGYQYLYLAGLPKENYPLCLGLEKCLKPTDGNAVFLLNNFATLKKEADWYSVVQEKTSPEINAIFGDMLFPIMDTTEKEMQIKMREWGYDEILKQIWFCHSPIHGEACGICPPCRCKISDKTQVSFSKEATARFKKWHKMSQKNEKLANVWAKFYIALFSHPKN